MKQIIEIKSTKEVECLLEKTLKKGKRYLILSKSSFYYTYVNMICVEMIEYPELSDTSLFPEHIGKCVFVLDLDNIVKYSDLKINEMTDNYNYTIDTSYGIRLKGKNHFIMTY